jgi:hypothetical protein
MTGIWTLVARVDRESHLDLVFGLTTEAIVRTFAGRDTETIFARSRGEMTAGSSCTGTPTFLHPISADRHR